MAFTTINLGNGNIGGGGNHSTLTPENMPFHLLVLGGFTGDSDKNSKLKPINVDRDNFDEIFERLSPSLSVSGLNENITFKTLEDFEPDHLFETLEVFSELRSLKRRISNAATFSSAAEEINAWSTHAKDSKPKIEKKQPVTQDSGETTSLLDSLLDNTERRLKSNEHGSQNDIAGEIIKDIIAPYISPVTNPKQSEYVKIIDLAIADEMSKILHHQSYQALESLWRGLYFLVRRLVTDNKLKIFVADISKERLTNDLIRDDIFTSDVYKELIESYNSVNSSQPWSFVFGHYQFSDNIADIQLLTTLSNYVTECNASFVSEADASLFGCNDIQQMFEHEHWNQEASVEWQALRNSENSRQLALGYPRFMLRLPYGNRGGAVESFEYEEMITPTHNDFLWSNGGLAISYLLAASYAEFRWQFKPGQLNEVTGLPMHIYEDDDGEKIAYPCAEVLLTERAAEKIITSGVIPSWTVKNSDQVRVGPFNSINISSTSLTGKWYTQA